jgi:hypothetical protein
MPSIHQAGQSRNQSHDRCAVESAVFDTGQNTCADFDNGEIRGWIHAKAWEANTAGFPEIGDGKSCQLCREALVPSHE